MITARESDANGVADRVRRFWHKPWREKAKSFTYRWATFRSSIHLPLRLPFGAWWVPRRDNLDGPLLAGSFETAELAFVERFLQPGMIVLDLGAHHGLYTLLASKRVGREGKVMSFEPSPRERRTLRLHLTLNRCQNVIIQESALGNADTQTDLYVVEGWETGCNSLKPPAVAGKTSLISVRVVRLDDVLRNSNITHVDFIKLDVEGAELGVLQGAARLLELRPRPVILAEVQDIRTQPWGYPARDIIRHLSDKGFRWFRLSGDGSLEELDVTLDAFDGNFVAWPEELGKTFYRGVIA
jgi:FkbM family methyltransferase